MAQTALFYEKSKIANLDLSEHVTRINANSDFQYAGWEPERLDI